MDPKTLLILAATFLVGVSLCLYRYLLNRQQRSAELANSYGLRFTPRPTEIMGLPFNNIQILETGEKFFVSNLMTKSLENYDSFYFLYKRSRYHNSLRFVALFYFKHKKFPLLRIAANIGKLSGPAEHLLALVKRYDCLNNYGVDIKFNGAWLLIEPSKGIKVTEEQWIVQTQRFAKDIAQQPAFHLAG